MNKLHSNENPGDATRQACYIHQHKEFMNTVWIKKPFVKQT